MNARAPLSPGIAALGDPTRGDIVRFLLDAPRSTATVGQLTEHLALRQPTVSHHLKILLRAGVVTREPRGREVWYSVPADVAARLVEWQPLDVRGAVDSALLDRMAADLEVRFAGTVSAETVRQVLEESARLLSGRPGDRRQAASAVAQFSADRLAALEASRAPRRPDRATSPIELLFVCVQNAGRSQIAAAIARYLGGDRVRVRTAGSAPTGTVRPSVVSALNEWGVPLGAEFPKPLTEEVVLAADVVVTMGCGDACPVFPGRRYLDWAVEDPADLPLDGVRAIRDDIDGRVRALLTELDVIGV
ncbi:MAG: metalloregulator ArsR/SmtB family transcription factor [Microcella sp.]|uniref:metalloregulator ArsR/SmtB family transcription factor n=1 Tax=Microcella sp. TaxID=1913979 RepID=UPI00331485A8